jgi:transposase
MVERHRAGIYPHCHPDKNVRLGLVEGVDNTIRVIQRKADGYRNEEYLKLKIIPSFLPPLLKNAQINPHDSA